MTAPTFISVRARGWRNRTHRSGYDAAVASAFAVDLVTACLDLDDWLATREALFDAVNAYEPDEPDDEAAKTHAAKAAASAAMCRARAIRPAI